jgi:uncharacterized protein HemY
MFARRTPQTAELTYSIAQHYYAAGSAFASQSLDHCLHAAHTARRQGDFSRARKYVTMAEHAARLSNRPVDFAKERLLIDAAEAKSASRRQSVDDSFISESPAIHQDLPA